MCANVDIMKVKPVTFLSNSIH